MFQNVAMCVFEKREKVLEGAFCDRNFKNRTIFSNLNKQIQTEKRNIETEWFIWNRGKLHLASTRLLKLVGYDSLENLWL